ncbi:MAG: PQQ-binding-like beta-propeller repeat protein [Eubacteriales bacterium]|nr:PQQ-binding-like beta-propeller repeat protein [Eubacteriales bacterium]
MPRQTRRRRRSVQPRFFVILFLFIIAVVMGALVLTDVFVPDKRSEKTEEKPGLLESIFAKDEPTPTPRPTPTPSPTPTPVPTFNPAPVEGTRPEDFGLEWAMEVNGQTVETYQADAPIDLLEGEDYTEAEGIITFRGNNFRDGASYGVVKLSEKTLDEAGAWTFSVGSMSKMYGEGSWTGCGWTGQPLIVRWPQETKQHMNMYDAAKADPALVEVIYATMDGRIYFLDLATGQKTRDPIDTGFPFKGAGALDPRGYPLMFVGAGDDSPSKGSARAFIISLIDGSVLYEFGVEDPFAWRAWTAFDSSALVDAETDTLIFPGESGILYLFKLHTQYDKAAGTISVSPEVVKWRYRGAKTDTTGKDGSEGWWLGMEDSAIVWRGHAIFTDNGGHMICLDLNNLTPVWVQDTLDDTNCTPVFELEGTEHHPYVYTSTSFHGGWRAAADRTARIPIWKVDAVNGKVVWENNDFECETISGVSGGVQGTMAIGKNKLADMIFVPVAMTEGSKGKLVALSKADGHQVWCCDFLGYPWSSPVTVYDAAGNGYIIQCNKSGYIHLIDGMTGTILFEMSLGSNIEASPAVFENTIVVGTRGGLIYGLKIK